jgi:acyl carrier protein
MFWHAACSTPLAPSSSAFDAISKRPVFNASAPALKGTASVTNNAQNSYPKSDPMIGDQVRKILTESGRLAVPVDTLGDDADLFIAGLDSLAIVNVLMSLEETFDIELPDDRLSRKTFASIETISSVVADLSQQAAHT